MDSLSLLVPANLTLNIMVSMSAKEKIEALGTHRAIIEVNLKFEMVR